MLVHGHLIDDIQSNTYPSAMISIVHPLIMPSGGTVAGLTPVECSANHELPDKKSGVWVFLAMLFIMDDQLTTIAAA